VTELRQNAVVRDRLADHVLRPEVSLSIRRGRYVPFSPG
jgi:hypothetical protein